MTQVEQIADESQPKDSCDKSIILPSKSTGNTGMNNNHHVHNNNLKAKGMDKTKIPSPLSAQKTKNGHNGPQSPLSKYSQSQSKSHHQSSTTTTKSFKLHWKSANNYGGDNNQPLATRVQIISVKLNRLRDWTHWTDFLEEVNNNSVKPAQPLPLHHAAVKFPVTIQKVLTLDGRQLSSLAELESQTELVVVTGSSSGGPSSLLSKSSSSTSSTSSSSPALPLSPLVGVNYNKSSSKCEIRPASASRVARRSCRASFTKSVIIETSSHHHHQDDNQVENGPLMKTFSEQNVSFKGYRDQHNLLRSPLPTPSAISKISTARPRASTTNSNNHNTARYRVSERTPPISSSPVSRIPKRISRASESVMSTSSPANLSNSMLTMAIVPYSTPSASSSQAVVPSAPSDISESQALIPYSPENVSNLNSKEIVPISTSNVSETILCLPSNVSESHSKALVPCSSANSSSQAVVPYSGRSSGGRMKGCKGLVTLEECRAIRARDTRTICVRDFVLPRLITIMVKGRKPRRAAKFLLNKKTAVAFDQVLDDITEAVKPDWGAIRKVYGRSGKEITTLDGFFQSDKIFIVYPNDKIQREDFEFDEIESRLVRDPTMLPMRRCQVFLPVSKSPCRVKLMTDSTQPRAELKDYGYASAIVPKQRQSTEYPERITKRYMVGKIIGDGNFAVVRECTDKVSGEMYALKVIDKSKCNRDTPADHEVTILTKVVHPNIILFFDQFNFNNELYVIMELVPGGDLFEAIAKCTKFNEVESAGMTKDVASALSFLHSRNIVHRDIKPENLLVSINNGLMRIKLGDFGLAQEITGPLYTVCGTPTYVAPEILAETGYGKPVDVWALGVILYVLLCGYPPFVSPSGKQEDLFDLILASDFEFHPEQWDGITLDAKNLICLMLEVDPEMRLGADEVLNHPFIAMGSEDVDEKRNYFGRRDDFKFSIFEKMGLTKLPLPNNAYANSSI